MKALAVLCALVFSVTLLAGTPTAKPQVAADTIPAIAGYKQNPYQYRYGNVQDAKIFQYHGHYLTNLMFKPAGTYLLFSESITFCGNQGTKLDFTKNDIVVLIYSRVMHRTDCYDLLRIDIVEKARAAGQNNE